MSEPSILDYASMRDLDQVMESVGQKVQTMVSLATELATSLSYQRAERAREAAASSEAERRQIKERQDALYEADRLVWRRTWDDRFWENATPERIARAWEACAPWAMQGFPSAQATIEHMRSEIKDRFGIDVDPVEVRGRDLATLLGVDVDNDARPVDAAASPEPARPEADRLESISYRIRDPHNDGTVTDTGIVHLASDDGPGVARQIAAELLDTYQGEHGSGERRFTIEVFDGDQPGTGTLLHSLDADTAAQVRDRYRAIVRQGRDADAQASAEGTAADIADVLRLERRRLREALVSLSNPGDAELPMAPKDPAERAQWARERSETIRDELARVGTRLQAAEADMRGEDGDVVLQWASLRYELDEQWWQSATGDEAAGLWEQVVDWPEGQARDRALNHLRAAFHREYEVELPGDASPQQVREAIGAKTARGGGRGTADELWGRARGEDAEAQRADHTGDRMSKDDPDSPTAGAEHAWARAQQEAAAQDRAAAGTYERLAEQGQSEAAEAASTVAHAYPAAPSARAARARTRRATGGPAPAKTKGPSGPEIGR